MRITAKVHASWMPTVDSREIKGLAECRAKWPNSIWAIRAPTCMQLERWTAAWLC
jgi:hypothetical protein